MAGQKARNTEVRSREEAVELLRLLKAISDRPGSRLTDLAEILGWGQTVVMRRVRALRKAGFEILTEENARGGGYYLTESPGVLEAVLGKKRSLPSTVYYTDEDLIERLKEIARELGRVPTPADLRDLGLSSTLYRHFGSTWQALEAAGLVEKGSRPSRVRYSDADLVAALKKKAKELGRPPLERDWDLSRPSLRTLIRRFGSWKEALSRAGLDRGQNLHSDEELLSALRRKAEELGRVPRMEDFRGERPGAKTISRRFGSWRNALAAAGLAEEEGR